MSEKHTDQTDSENYNPQHTEVSKDYKTPGFINGRNIGIGKTDFKTFGICNRISTRSHK